MPPRPASTRRIVARAAISTAAVLAGAAVTRPVWAGSPSTDPPPPPVEILPGCGIVTVKAHTRAVVAFVAHSATEVHEVTDGDTFTVNVGDAWWTASVQMDDGYGLETGGVQTCTG